MAAFDPQQPFAPIGSNAGSCPKPAMGQIVEPTEHQKLASHARHKADHDDCSDKSPVALITRRCWAGGRWQFLPRLLAHPMTGSLDLLQREPAIFQETNKRRLEPTWRGKWPKHHPT
jgi:hypothetical protein